MKKRFLSIVSVMLVASMMAATVTGCGARTKATDITIDDGDTIIVDEEDLETEENVDSDNITETEVIGGDAEETEDANTSVGAEDENIVLYDEIAEYGEFVPMQDQVFEPVSNTFIANDNLPVYNVDGIEVGYIKEGSTITFTGYASNAWARFENPIEGTDYDYLYGFKEYADVPDTDQITVTASDVKQRIIDGITGLEVTDYTFVDTPTSDMEVFEFRIESAFDNEVDFNFWYSKCTEDGNIALSNYMTYCIECEEDTDGWISCKVYYKDEIPEDVWNQYYYGN